MKNICQAIIAAIENKLWVHCALQGIRGECQNLINHFEDNPEEVAMMVGQKESSKTVSNEALMTVFHPQDAENLDPKMVGFYSKI